MTDRVRIGLVGCGRAAERIYLPAFARVDEAHLVAVADPSPERRGLVSEASGAADFPGLDEMLATCELDAVIVATPPETHAELVVTSLRGRCAILVEKPLAATLADAQRLADAAESTDRPVLVGFNRRRLAAAERLRTMLEGVEGPRIRLESEFHALPTLWDPVSGVRDPLDDLASHHLDLFRFLTGAEIETVDARRRLGTEAVELHVGFESGAHGLCTVSQGSTSRERVWLHLDSGGGNDGRRTWMLRPSSDRLTPPGGVRRVALDRLAGIADRLRGRPDPMARSFAAQLEALVACVRGPAAPTPGVSDGLAVARVVEQARAQLDG